MAKSTRAVLRLLSKDKPLKRVREKEKGGDNVDEKIDELLQKLGADKAAVQTDTNDNSNLLYVLLLSLLMSKPATSDYDNRMLEKEVSYLRGKLDTMEKLLFRK